MSNTDPDLKPTEKNRPTAIDVVDGNLIVKRHSGKKESFPLMSLQDTDWFLTVLFDRDPQGSSQGPSFSAPITMAQGLDHDSNDLGSLISSDLDSAGANGIQLGPSYRFSRSGADSLYFTEPGFYLVSITATVDAGTGTVSPGGLGIEAYFAGGVITPSWQARGNEASGYGPKLAFILPVTPVEVAPAGPAPLAGGMSNLIVSLWQDSGSSRGIHASMNVLKVS